MGPAVTATAVTAVAVVVPARDEGELIAACLRSLLRAADHVADRATVRVVVAADSCTDATVDVVRHTATGDRRVGLLEGRWRQAGRARRAGTERAVADLGTPAAATWLAATDADSEVPEGWLHDHLVAAGAGWHAVAGTVRLRTLDTDLAARFAAGYLLPTDRPHPHVHGANLGIRLDAYREVGGWPVDGPTGEDQRLWDAVRRSGRPYGSDVALHVHTSDRRIARAPGGFAARLAELAP